MWETTHKLRYAYIPRLYPSGRLLLRFLIFMIQLGIPHERNGTMPLPPIFGILSEQYDLVLCYIPTRYP